MTGGIRGGPDRHDRGAAAVELAIILPILLILLGGIIDFGRLFYGEIVVAGAAREGARMLAISGTEPDAGVALAETRALSAAPNPQIVGEVSAIALRTCASPTTTSSRYEVSAEFSWLLLDAFLPISSPTPRAIAEMRCGG